MIDLHTHTTASDGRSTPAGVVHEAAAAGVQTLAVTDHDTLAGLDAAVAAGLDVGLTVVRGIEMTAVDDGRDVHLLGLFLDRPDEALDRLLETQRLARRHRVAEIASRLERLGVGVDLDELLATVPAETGRAIGRPAVARALVARRHVASLAEAFDRFLGDGRPAFVPRQGPAPVTVVGHLARVGAIAALAHPGKTRRDDLIGALVEAGMVAIEVFHPDHSPEDVVRYSQLARDLGLLRTGGSDYHGPGSGRAAGLGRVGLPRADYDALVRHATRDRPR